LKKYGTIFLIFVFCATVAAYTRVTNSIGQMPKWPSMPVSYWINEKGSPQILNGSDFAAVQAAFQTWQNIPTADIRFAYKGTTPVSTVGYDGMNVITFIDASTPLGSSTIAATFSFYGSVLNSAGVIVYGTQEADIAFNPAFSFSTSAETARYDIQGVITHEIGHFLGLDHAGLISSVMVPFSAASQLDQRTLSYDDIAGVMEIYPKSLPAVGQIQGTIQSGFAAPVFGAHVVAVDSGGSPVVSTLSQPDGSYLLRFIPPGSYRVYAEPLDLPVTRDNIGGGAAGFYGTTRTNFGTTYFGGVAALADASAVTVRANATTTANIQTLPANATALNLTRPAFGVRLASGVSDVLTLGGEALAAGVSFSASSPGVFLGIPSGACSATITTNCFGDRISAVASTSAKMDISIADSATLGPKNVTVTQGADSSILSGGLVITATKPAGIAVTPASGSVDGGTVVTVTGTNFRPDAQVYFAGLLADSVRLLDAGTLQATTPAGSPGYGNVVVMNSDGTWGVAQSAFSFVTAPPVITAVSPLSGPAGTVVAIEGQHFGTLKQNVQVTFGGTPTRIISLADNAIQTIVPYGAGTGAVQVNVIGQTATGPDFTVLNTAASTNLATTQESFKDASFSSGGTPLTFGDPDDSVAFTPLPFTFSIFRDVYAAGERISISTNGWISLEGATDRGFQNSTLPAVTVPQTLGGTGTVPPSLIAPYWDDLFLNAGTGNVNVNVTGAAPNRQFIIEWSNMSVINDQGSDQHSNITFEAILFEGSNDVQFVYGDMTGPLSDGSSATVGMQDLKRTTAVLTSFNQPSVKSRSVITYSYRNGNYLTAASSVILPKPVVTDEGAVTANPIQLAASWSQADPAAGITSYQFAIGTTPGGTDVRPFTPTTQNSVVVSGLNLQVNTTYYFAVKAVGGGGVTSEMGFSDGIRFDPAFQPQIKIIPAAPQSSSEFSGIALLVPPSASSMNVVLRAFDATGAYILGPGIRNPVTVSLATGQQSAKLVSELFGVQTFDGWIQVEASAGGLGVFTATGALDLSAMDGTVARDLSTDFVMFHAGATAILVNPSPRVATVSITDLGTGNIQQVPIPATGRLVSSLSGAARVKSTEALAAIERVASPGRLTINAGEPISAAQTSPVFPDAVAGTPYSSILTLVNVTGTAQDVSISFGGTTRTSAIDANAVVRIPLTSSTQVADAVRVTGQSSILGIVDIDNSGDPVTVGVRPAATDFLFPHIANGYGLFTGLAIVAGNTPATVTIEIYDSNGGPPKSSTITLSPGQQLARLASELVAGVATQSGGYIHIRSDQPIWAWEIYGSGRIMASGPPL
jgi:hypothetical protein